MNDAMVGRTLRALRRRLGLRQVDLAGRAGVSQQRISDIERGRIPGVAVGTLRRVFAAVDAEAITLVRWRGGTFDSLLDEGHADIVGRIVKVLQGHGWQVLTEATFSEWGERGSVDVLAWHAPTRTLLVVEVKTEITSAEELLRSHDVKVRLGPSLAEARFGSRPRHVARLLVVAESPTNRRRMKRLDPVMGSAYPLRGAAVRSWLRNPIGTMAGAIFVSGRADPNVRSRRRVRPAAT